MSNQQDTIDNANAWSNLKVWLGLPIDASAGKVRNTILAMRQEDETGLPPRQLLKQRDMLREIVKLFVYSQYCVCTSINPRGYNWFEKRLDELLPEAMAALSKTEGVKK